MGLLSRLNNSLPRMAAQEPPPEEPWYSGENVARIRSAERVARASSPVQSPWVVSAQNNTSGRSLQGGLPAPTVQPRRK